MRKNMKPFFFLALVTLTCFATQAAPAKSPSLLTSHHQAYKEAPRLPSWKIYRENHRSTTTTATKSAVETIRGGAGPLNRSEALAKATILLVLAQTIPMWLSPAKALEMYSKLSADTMNIVTIQRLFTVMLASHVMLYSSFFSKTTTTTSLRTALGVANFPWMAFAIQSLMDGTANNLGFSARTDYVTLALGALRAYLTLSDDRFTDELAHNVTKAFGVFGLINGALLTLAPSWVCRTWGWDANDRDDVSGIIKATGLFWMQLGFLDYTLASGMDKFKAFGYSSIPCMAWQFTALFVSKEAEKFGVPSVGYYFWLLLHSVVIVSLAL